MQNVTEMKILGQQVKPKMQNLTKKQIFCGRGSFATQL